MNVGLMYSTDKNALNTTKLGTYTHKVGKAINMNQMLDEMFASAERISVPNYGDMFILVAFEGNANNDYYVKNLAKSVLSTMSSSSLKRSFPESCAKMTQILLHSIDIPVSRHGRSLLFEVNDKFKSRLDEMKLVLNLCK